ncbi:MAG: hypothetical protein ACOY0T_35855 [Myxococcota bacterium]
MVYGAHIHRLTSLHRTVALATWLACSACSGGRPATRTELSPGVVFPHSIAEGKGDDFGPEPPRPSTSSTPASAGSAAPPSATSSSSAAPSPSAAPSAAPTASASAPGGPPDPEPLRLNDQWEYELVFDAGKASVAATRARHFDKPLVSARRMGRFAIELWIGRELVERVRFDFPGLGLEAPPEEQGPRRPLYPPASFAKGVHARQTVLVPASPRARRAVLVDRATGETQVLPWPPDHPLNEPATPPQ